MISLDSLIKQHFQYLIDTYGYYIDHEQYSTEVMGNAEIVYKSAQTGISIIVDRSQVLLNIGNISWSERDWFEFSDVVHYFSPKIEFVYAFQNDNQDAQVDIEGQIKWAAIMLMQYCDPILRGDFSMQREIREIEKRRVAKLLKHFNNLSKGEHS
jgi:hypothetical protein